MKLPNLSRVDFYRLKEDELIAALAAAIAGHVEQHANAELSSDHLAVSVWERMAVDVPNGGFTQFFALAGHNSSEDVRRGRGQIQWYRSGWTGQAKAPVPHVSDFGIFRFVRVQISFPFAFFGPRRGGSARDRTDRRSGRRSGTSTR